MAVIQTGINTPGAANVNSDFELEVGLPKTQSRAGYVAALAEIDGGTLTGTRRLKALQTSESGSLKTTEPIVMLDYHFNTTVQDTGLWRYLSSTMTASWGTVGLLLNASAIGTTTTAATVSTWRHFNHARGALQIDFIFNLTTELLPNQELQLGWSPFAAGVPTEGVYMKLTTAGLFGYSNFNSSEANVTGEMATAASFTPNVCYTLSMVIYKDTVYFWLNDELLPNGVLPNAAANGQPASTGAFPVTAQFRNFGTASGGPIGQARITDIVVTQFDSQLGLQMPAIQALRGLMASQGTAGNVQGSTALIINNQAPGVGAAIANTAAAASFLGLGGQFAVLPTLAVNTDGILCSYQVPAGSINIQPRSLLIYGVKISGIVSTALTGNATPVAYQYSLAYGHSTVSLATAEAATTKAARRLPLGFETYAAAAPVATLGQGVAIQLQTPILVSPGEFVAIAAKNIGAVTTAGVITFSVTYDAIWI